MGTVQRKRLFAWGVVVVVGIALVGFALAPSPVPCDTATVVRGDLEVTLDHEAKTRVRDRFEISAPLPGRVLRINLEPGDPVIAGETILATFEPSDPVPLDARSMAEAQARVKAAQASLEAARAQRDRARAERDLAVKEVERHRSLAAQGIVSASTVDVVEADAEARADALVAAEAAVRNAAHELEAAHATLLQPRDPSVASTGPGGAVLTLRSPVDGVVLRRLRESEAVVPAGEVLLEVADPQDLEIVADYLSTDAVRMRPGMRAWIDRWGGEDVLEARVRRVEPSGFMKISALGVEEQRVNVILDLADPERARPLGDGYRVESRVVIEERAGVVKVPTSALFRDGDAWAVFIVDGGRATLRAVEIGARNRREAEVLASLDVGERVIVHPSDDVGDGVRVEERGG